MVRGLYTAWTGLATEQKRLDIISNNIANAATVGYKEESVTNQAFQKELTLKIRDGSEGYVDRSIGTMSLGVKVGEVYTDYDQGSLRQTGNTYDLAIEGKGFFQVRVVDGNGNSSIRYTRAGEFIMTKEGYIVDKEGNFLQGEGGDLKVDTSAAVVAIDADGTIFADGEIVGKVALTDFEDYDYLEKVGDVSYRLVNGGQETEVTGSLRQGFLEQSNVQSVSEMVELINITRTYETNQKIMQTVDAMLDKAVNSVGQV